jgi:hypothetical protein
MIQTSHPENRQKGERGKRVGLIRSIDIFCFLLK